MSHNPFLSFYIIIIIRDYPTEISSVHYVSSQALSTVETQ